MLQVDLGSHKYLKVKKNLKESVYNVYRSEKREKQGIVVYRQTVTSLRFVSLLFRAHDLLKMANINPQQKKIRFSLRNKLVLANTFLRKFYFAVKIKLSQKLYTTRYLSINTEFLKRYLLSSWLSTTTGVVSDLAAAGSIKNNFLFLPLILARLYSF